MDAETEESVTDAPQAGGSPRGEVLHGGTVIGIGDDCGLMVHRPDGNVEVLRTGEVTVRLKED